MVAERQAAPAPLSSTSHHPTKHPPQAAGCGHADRRPRGGRPAARVRLGRRRHRDCARWVAVGARSGPAGRRLAGGVPRDGGEVVCGRLSPVSGLCFCGTVLLFFPSSLAVWRPAPAGGAAEPRTKTTPQRLELPRARGPRSGSCCRAAMQAHGRPPGRARATSVAAVWTFTVLAAGTQRRGRMAGWGAEGGVFERSQAWPALPWGKGGVLAPGHPGRLGTAPQLERFNPAPTVTPSPPRISLPRRPSGRHLRCCCCHGGRPAGGLRQRRTGGARCGRVHGAVAG